MNLFGSAYSDPPADDGGGRMFGVVRGVVTDNRDPERLGRVRVRLPWQEQGSGLWAGISVPMAGAGYGTWFLPDVGDEVLVGAENGDPAHLYVLGMLWNARSLPPASNMDGRNDLRLIKSRSGHHLLFDDSEGAPVLEIKLADGKRLTLDNEGVLIDDAAGNVIAVKSGGSEIAITSNAKISLKSEQISIEAENALELRSGGTLTLKGALVQIN